MCVHGQDIKEINEKLSVLPLMKKSIEDNNGWLEKLEKQVKATNGKVQTLERWKSYITGGLAVLTIIVVPLMIWYANDFMEARNQHIENAIDTKVSEVHGEN